MAMSYEYYKIFYYVGKYRSISKAAKELKNSQPNVSRAMHNLENELGCKLLERKHTGVTLTEDGELLFKHIEYAQKHFETAEIALENSKNPQKKKLYLGFSIGISELVLYNVILPVISEFLKQHANVSIQVINDPTPDLITSVEEGNIDLAVITDSTRGREYGREWITFQDILIAGSAYQELKDKEISLAELIKYPIISPRRGTETFQFYHAFFSSEGLLFQPDIETASADQVLPFVENGMGLGFVAEGFAYNAMERHKIIRVATKEQIPQRKVNLLRNQDKALSEEIEELENMLLTTSLNSLKHMGAKYDV